MRYRVLLSQLGDQRYLASCPDFSGCKVEGATREEVLQRIRNAIGYYEEHCPCDVTADSGIELEIIGSI